MAENNPAISVIIPLYNAEKYVGECLDSLLAQTFQDFEVIVVDDCSTDYSRSVIYGYFPKFNDRLKLAKLNANSGRPGIPRNFAMESARGKYIYFLDADDVLSETAFEELYDVAENFSAEVVHVEKFAAFSDGVPKEDAVINSIQKDGFVSEPIIETPFISERVSDFMKRKYLWWACNKLFLRKFLENNDIKFAQTKTFEDLIFTFMCVVNAKVYVRVPFVSYYYRVRRDSLSRNPINIVEIIERAFAVFNALDKFMDGHEFFKDNPKYKFAVLDFFMQERLEVIARNLFGTSNLNPAELFNLFKEKLFVNSNYGSLTAYLFITANIFKLYTKQQAEEISALKQRLEVEN